MRHEHKTKAIFLFACLLFLAFLRIDVEAGDCKKYTADTEEDLSKIMRKAVLKRQQDVKIIVNRNIDITKVDMRLIGSRIRKSGNINDGIEITNSIKSIRYFYAPGMLELKIEYHDSYRAVQYVNRKVNKIYKKLNLKKGTRKAKVRKIHDYLIDAFDYDYTYESYTAYDMLKSGKGVCYSFASLFYKLCKKAGIPCVIVNGVTDSYHAWNYVKIKGTWKLVDVTFDETAKTDRYFITSTPSTHKVLAGPYEKYKDLYRTAHPRFYKEFLKHYAA